MSESEPLETFTVPQLLAELDEAEEQIRQHSEEHDRLRLVDREDATAAYQRVMNFEEYAGQLREELNKR